MKNIFKVLCCVLIIEFMGFDLFVTPANAQTTATVKVKRERFKKRVLEPEEIEQLKEADRIEHQELINELQMPEDMTPQLKVGKIVVGGNSLITTDELLDGLPNVYNASDKSLKKAPANSLYDMSTVQDILIDPGPMRNISARKIQGFTQYILSEYQKKGYGGIYVYVPADQLSKDMLNKEGLLRIEIIETTVSSVEVVYHDVDGTVRQTGYLRKTTFEKWSPLEVGETVNKKELDDYLGLLNLNPDRYVSATVSKGDQPKSIDVKYDIYESCPWHYFFQIDNAGTEDREWTPRVGVINTNLLGRDDVLTGVFQSPWDSTFEDNYSVFGSYDFPLWTPRVRGNIFAGKSEFNVNSASDIDFLGDGIVYGAGLKFHLFQKNDWFFDLTGSVRHEESEVTPSLFPQFLGSDLDMDIWSIGADLYKTDDMSDTFLTYTRFETFGGSDAEDFEQARAGASRNFAIHNFGASHNRYLDTTKVQRLLASITYIVPEDRLVPAKMTTFGGLYTVRGYEESGIVADGGYIGSVQYEYDLVQCNNVKGIPPGHVDDQGKPFIRKFAPLVFFDFARADVKDSLPGEESHQEMYSVGPGLIVELGDSFLAGLYYGFPLKDAGPTNGSNGKFSVNLMMRW